MKAVEELPPQKSNKIRERIPKTNKPRVVIIGGGFAGIELVRVLEKQDFQIVMIDKQNHHTFIPLLYQVATAGLSPGDISSPLREFLKENKDFHFRLAKVKEVKAEEKIVSTSLGDLEFDILVIATGATTNFFGNKDLAKNAMKLREMSDAIELRTKLLENFEEALQIESDKELEKFMNVVIVGAGPTGVELAGAIAELQKQVLPNDYPELDFSKMKIHLVEGLDEVLAPMSSYASKKAARYLEQFGVNVSLNKMVKKYEDGVVYFDDDTTIKANCLIWAAGVKGNLVKGLKEDQVTKSRITVDEYHQVVGLKDVYAIGDVAHQTDEKYPDGLPQLAPVAIQQAENLAKNLIRISSKKSPKPFSYLDKGTMATIGRNKAVVDAPFGIRIGGFLGWFIWMFVHLISIIGMRRKLMVFSNWVWNYFTYNRGNRLIIRKDLDESLD